MNTPTRIVVSLVVALVAGAGYMAVDKMRGAEWVVSPQQIAEAKAKGQMGYESQPGTVTVLPIRSETADVLPMKWAMIGLVAGLLTFRATGRKKRQRPEGPPLFVSALCAGDETLFLAHAPQVFSSTRIQLPWQILASATSS